MHSRAYELPPYKYNGIEIKISGTVSESYSDNITFGEEDKEGDFLTVLGLILNVEYEPANKRRGGGLIGSVNRQFRAKSFDVVNSSESLTLGFQNEFSKYDRLNLTNTFTHSQIPTTFEEEFGRAKGRIDAYRNSFNLSYDRGISKYVSVNTAYTNGINRSSREGVTDSYQNNLNFGVNYDLSIATAFLLTYALNNTKFKGGGDTTTQSINLGARQNITKQLVINGSIGVLVTPSATETSVGASITQPIDIDRRTTANLSFSRDIQISSDRENIFKNWRFTGSISRDWLKDLSSSFSTFYGEGEFESTGIKDRLLGADVKITYIFWEHRRGAKLDGRFGYTYSNLDSSDESRGYTRNTVSWGLNIGF